MSMTRQGVQEQVLARKSRCFCISSRVPRVVGVPQAWPTRPEFPPRVAVRRRFLVAAVMRPRRREARVRTCAPGGSPLDRGLGSPEAGVNDPRAPQPDRRLQRRPILANLRQRQPGVMGDSEAASPSRRLQALSPILAGSPEQRWH